MDTILLRCGNCGAVNKLLKDKLSAGPKCGKCKAPLDYPGRPVDVTSGSFQKEVLSCPGVVLVEFWSPSCGYCLRLDPVLEQLAREKAGILKIVKINTHAEQYLPSQYGIRGVPALLLFRNGNKINQITGAMSKQQLEEWVRSSI
jgi:thioredoxin 2